MASRAFAQGFLVGVTLGATSGRAGTVTMNPPSSAGSRRIVNVYGWSIMRPEYHQTALDSQRRFEHLVDTCHPTPAPTASADWRPCSRRRPRRARHPSSDGTRPIAATSASASAPTASGSTATAPSAGRRWSSCSPSVLRKDADGRHYLVTPVEKMDVAVDDAPFLAVEMEVRGSRRGAEPDLPHQRRRHRHGGAGASLALRHRGRQRRPQALSAGARSPGGARHARARLRSGGARRGGGKGAGLGLWSGGAFFPMPECCSRSARR